MNKVTKNIKNRNYWVMAAFAVIIGVWVSVPFLTGQAQSISEVPILTLTATLHAPNGAVNPHGDASYELYQSGNRELEVEAEDLSLARETGLDVIIDGNVTGQAVVDNNGKAKLKLRTEDGQTVPTVNNGSTVEVRNGSTVLVNGVFARGNPTPTGTATGAPSASPTATGTLSPSPSQTGTETPSPSQTGTTTPSPSPTGTPAVRTAILTAPNGAVNPHGSADYHQQQYYGSILSRELEVEVEDLTLAQGTVLTAFLDGNAIGALTVDDRQRAKLKLSSDNGQTVPAVNDGSTIEVRNGATVLVSGVFGAGATATGTATATPSPSQTGTSSPSPSQTGTASPSPTGTPNGGNLFAGLIGPTLNGVVPTGYSAYEVHSDGVELEVRIRQINLQIGTVLSVVIDGQVAGTITVQSGAEGRLRLRSEDGQSVPVVIEGSAISVRNGETTILSGAFSRMATGTGTPTGTPSGTPSPTPADMGRSFEAHLTGSQLTPPVTTAANGEIKVRLNAAGTQATVSGEFHNLSSDQTGAVIQTTVGTPVTIRDLGIVGGREGNFATVTFDITPEVLQQLNAGLLFAIISSVNNPFGEIGATIRRHSSNSDFDGDGQNDVAVFRPSTGMWYADNTNGFSALSFGSASDRIVSADYDGDGKTDIAVYRDENGQGVWEIKRSSDGGVTTIAHGLSTDIPVRGDFDGDGRIDIAVFRPSDGNWYIQKSDNTGEVAIHFGLAEDKPIPADMDGDGRDDIVVFRPSQGNWYWLRSSDGQSAATNFGLSGDIPVRGDFDGDGKDDVTVYRPSNGTWYTLRSSDGGVQAMQFGLNGDVPVAGNYDADGKTDIAVFRPSDGNWYILRSSDGQFQASHFGLSGDIPAIAR